VVVYRNYRNETKIRRIRPVRFWFGKSTYHLKPGWMCTALDLDRPPVDGQHVARDFAMVGMLAWGEDQAQKLKAMQDALVIAAGG
jgi:hypothetical protein